MTSDPGGSSRISAPVTRRALFGLGALAALRARAVEAQIYHPSSPEPTIDATQLKLARRLTNGPTAGDVQDVRSAGYNAYLETQLDWAAINDDACTARLAALTTIDQPTSALLALNDSGTVTKQLAEAAILRAVYSRRQLYERTVEFWSDHFSTSINTVGIYKTAEVRDVYRKYALATFREMLYASAAGPAMLTSLNGAQNTKSAPNQNYAREVMELHTLGVDGGYTQQDVIEVARCFTGFRIYGTTGDATGGTTYFDPTLHDQNSKLVLGIPIAPGGGAGDAVKVLDILAAHPSTARFVSRKLLRWFVDYEPSAALVTNIAEVFRRTRGNISDVVRHILAYDNMAAAPPLFKRPFHLIVSALRGVSANITTLDTIRNTYLAGVGQAPYTWGPPNGFPQDVDYWAALPLPRWNFAFNLALGGNSVPGVSFDLAAIQAGATTAAQIGDRFDTLLFAGQMNPADKAALVAYLKPDNPTATRVRDALGLALACPGFQWH